MKNLKLFIFLSFCFICNSTSIFAQREGGANLDTTIKGHNVGMVMEQSAQTIFKWIQTGDKSWECTNSSTNRSQGTFTEIGRDEWSVYMTNTSTGRKFQIDLWQKKVYDKSTGLETFGDILQVGLRPETTSVPPTNPTPSAGWATFNPGASYFFITNIGNKKVFDVAASGTKVGTNVGMWGKHEGNNQKFKFVSKGNGYYAIETALKKDTYLSVHNSGKADNTNIKLNNPVGQQQHFKIEKNTKGEVRFISKLGNDLYIGTDDNGSNLALRKGEKGNKTLFSLTPTNANSPTPNNNGNSGTITLVNTATTFVVTVSKVGNSDFSKEIGPNQNVKVNCKVGDVFTFSTSSDGFEALPFSVIKTGVTYRIVVGERYTSGKGNKLPNTKASRHSFDIKKVDPIYIDYTKSQSIKDKKGKTIGQGGMRKEIFKSLSNQDIDWYNGDGDYAMKNHFSYELLMETQASTETKMFYSASAYEKSFSANVGADTPKGGGSATFSHTSSNSESESNIYSYSRTKVRAYSVNLNKNELVLTNDFKKAVMSLPKGYNESSYMNFINSWGTHYPQSTTYGGTQVAAYKFNAKEMMQSESMAIGVEGNVKAVSAGGGYSNNKEFNQKEENSKGMYRSKGGSGTGENFAVDMSNSVPVEIDLKRLHELLTTTIFNDGTNSSELSARKENLKKAITKYIGSATDNGQSLRPRMYKISKVKWQATKGESDFQVYGKVWISIWEKGKDSSLKGKTPFSRSDAGGSRVIARNNYTASCPGEIVYSIFPKNGKMNLDNYYIKLSSELKDWNASSSNEAGGYKKTLIYCDQVPMMPKNISHDVSFPREETRIRVSANVQEINLGFDD